MCNFGASPDDEPGPAGELNARHRDVNRKRVQRLMWEDNLLCLTKRKFVVPTTDSNHRLKVYPNRVLPVGWFSWADAAQRCLLKR